MTPFVIMTAFLAFAVVGAFAYTPKK